MHWQLRFSTEAGEQLADLKASPALAGECKQVLKALGFLETNPKHPGLKSHEFTSLSTKEYKVWESYAQNDTPGAYRIFWRYGPDEKDAKKKRIAIISIIALIPHP
jgi:hypothetical protein